MTSININELPLVSTATNTDVLILNVNNTLTSAITFQDFSANLNVFTNPGKFPDGTAADPSITFVNNDNNDIGNNVAQNLLTQPAGKKERELKSLLCCRLKVWL